MRFLKKKMAHYAQTQVKIEPESQLTQQSPLELPFSRENVKQEPKEEISSQQSVKTHKKRSSDAKSTKTVVKNYGKAIASFALNPISHPYLKPLIEQEGVKIEDFCTYISRAKETIEGIDTFRALLLVKNQDSQTTASYKRVFQEISEIFIKYFSVNWIYSGRMTNKEVHLKVRFKMLRRIRSPELFTYLK